MTQITKVTPTTFSFPRPVIIEAELDAPDVAPVAAPAAAPEALVGLVFVLAAAEAEDELFAAAVVLSGPVRKKLPATGLPRPVCSANSEMLKLLTGVEALTRLGAT